MLKDRTFRVALFLMFVGLAMAFALANIRASSTSTEEHASDQLPVVKITSPENNSIHEWNTLVPYSIVVTDNGKSTKYQEIPAKEVLLQTMYVSDVPSMVPDSSQMKNPEPDGLRDIMRSNCLGCHEFRAKAMGPSFSAIGERYAHKESMIEMLSQHIQNGSVGIWGQARMPAHRELTEATLRAMSLWILKGLVNPNVNYYVGTDGTFKMATPETPNSKSGLVVTASYISNGTKENSNRAMEGEETIVVHGR